MLYSQKNRRTRESIDTGARGILIEWFGALDIGTSAM